MKKARKQRETEEVCDSRRMLAIETLNGALKSDRTRLGMALALVMEGRLLSGNEDAEDLATMSLRMLESFDKSIRSIFGSNAANERTMKLHLAAKTLVEEIAVHRESAFWLLERNDVLRVERDLTHLIEIYQNVRRIVRLLEARDMESIPADPASLAAIPPNRYLPITHPEVCR